MENEVVEVAVETVRVSGWTLFMWIGGGLSLFLGTAAAWKYKVFGNENHGWYMRHDDLSEQWAKATGMAFLSLLVTFGLSALGYGIYSDGRLNQIAGVLAGVAVGASLIWLFRFVDKRQTT